MLVPTVELADMIHETMMRYEGCPFEAISSVRKENIEKTSAMGGVMTDCKICKSRWRDE
jgi:hypothetical protein